MIQSPPTYVRGLVSTVRGSSRRRPDPVQTVDLLSKMPLHSVVVWSVVGVTTRRGREEYEQE